mmetsp:Transcript_80635/g.246489  ORF Transcript_80635/g.246489 Transcript_80635/m.246489 type:complete len:240 (+) Transcript_80635:408-1127(+)
MVVGRVLFGHRTTGPTDDRWAIGLSPRAHDLDLELTRRPVGVAEAVRPAGHELLELARPHGGGLSRLDVRGFDAGGKRHTWGARPVQLRAVLAIDGHKEPVPSDPPSDAEWAARLKVLGHAKWPRDRRPVDQGLRFAVCPRGAVEDVRRVAVPIDKHKRERQGEAGSRKGNRVVRLDLGRGSNPSRDHQVQPRVLDDVARPHRLERQARADPVACRACLHEVDARALLVRAHGVESRLG